MLHLLQRLWLLFQPQQVIRTVTAELALAHAVATFAGGRTFEESADATPANVNAKIRPHFPRLALTRAKARALRDALNISMVAVEELEA